MKQGEKYVPVDKETNQTESERLKENLHSDLSWMETLRGRHAQVAEDKRDGGEEDGEDYRQEYNKHRKSHTCSKHDTNGDIRSNPIESNHEVCLVLNRKSGAKPDSAQAFFKNSCCTINQSVIFLHSGQRGKVPQAAHLLSLDC